MKLYDLPYWVRNVCIKVLHFLHKSVRKVEWNILKLLSQINWKLNTYKFAFVNVKKGEALLDIERLNQFSERHDVAIGLTPKSYREDLYYKPQKVK